MRWRRTKRRHDESGQATVEAAFALPVLLLLVLLLVQPGIRPSRYGQRCCGGLPLARHRRGR